MLAVCLNVYYISYLSKVLKVSASRQSILRNNILETKCGQLKLNYWHSSDEGANDDWIWAPFTRSFINNINCWLKLKFWWEATIVSNTLFVSKMLLRYKNVFCILHHFANHNDYHCNRANIFWKEKCHNNSSLQNNHWHKIHLNI